MDSKKKFIFAIISSITILFVSLFVAFICFKLLESTAETNLKGWKLGGAFAGFVFTASMLTSIVFQFYRQMTAEQVEDYRALVQELQSKLIKSAPCPDNFTIDIDERHKLVFARPTEWIPRGGLLYQYVNRCASGNIPANFNVTFLSNRDLLDYYRIEIGEEKLDLNDLYKKVITYQTNNVKNAFPEFKELDLMQEYTVIDEVKSVKYVHKYSYSGGQNKDKERIIVNVCQAGLYCYVKKAKGIFIFTFSDDEEEYLRSSEVFNSVISSIRFL